MTVLQYTDLVCLDCPLSKNRGQKQHFVQYHMSSITSADLSEVCLHLLWRETTSQPAKSFHWDSLKS